LFGYFPAPFVFGGVADLDKENPLYSMRLAIGTITYWSILAALFLLGAILCKFGTKDSDETTQNEENVKEREMIHVTTGLPIVVSPREALSSNFGDS